MLKRVRIPTAGRWPAALVCLLLAAAPRCGAAQEIVDVQCFAGAPLGVGRMTVRLPAGSFVPALGDNGFTLTERDGRALYQAFDNTPVRTLLRDALRRPQVLTAYFLFTGEEPLALNLYAPTAIARTATPRRDRAGYDQLLAAWWAEYTQAVRRDGRNDQFPPLVDNYLTTMLATRLRLTMPSESPGLLAIFDHKDANKAVNMLLGAESLRVALQKETMLRGPSGRGAADQPLPPAVAGPAIAFPEPPADVAVEPIALHVPPECFYLRSGNYPNYQWFRHTLDEWGGDLRNLVAQRGLDYGINAKLERQLSLRENALATLLGPKVIEDVAVIGADPFFREGPAMGMLFQAKSNFFLARDVNGQRAETLKNEKDATETTLDVAGHKVSFLATPDNRVRSFYAVDGDFHLVTTSKAIVKRFYEVAADKQSLGASREFRLARGAMPLARQDSVFIYLSDPFFRKLLSPQTHIELNRRLQAETDLDLVRLARLAATAERRPAETIDDLVAGGFLPAGFGSRADGSRLMAANGVLIDSLRGAPATFAPVGDVDFDRVSAAEAQAYEEFGRMFLDQWGQMDPVMIGIGRRASDLPGLEHVTLDVQLNPFAEKHLGMLGKILGPASDQRVARVAGDVASLELVSSGSLLGGGAVTHLFGGMRDSNPPYEVIDGRMVPLGIEQNLNGYLGAWPKPGALSFFGFRPDAPADAAGFASPRPGLWQRSWESFSVLSNHRETLEAVTRDMHLEQAPRPAQVRLHLGDLTQQKLSKFTNAFAYFQAKRVSGGNLLMLHELQSQLHVPAERAMAVAGEVVGGRLVCTVGGEYKMREQQGELPTWISTSFDNRRRLLDQKAPDGYLSPPLQWLRGLDLDFGAHDGLLSAHVELDMQHPTKPGQAGFTVPAPPAAPTPKTRPEELPAPGAPPATSPPTAPPIPPQENPPPSKTSPPKSSPPTPAAPSKALDI